MYIVQSFCTIYDCQCQSRNSPGFDPSILRPSAWGAADEAVLNTAHKSQKIPLLKKNHRFVHCVCIYEGYISKFPKEQIGVDYMYRYSICMVNFCGELTYYGLRTRSFSVADFSSTSYPPVTQRENILKGSLTRVFRLPDFFMNQFPQAP